MSMASSHDMAAAKYTEKDLYAFWVSLPKAMKPEFLTYLPTDWIPTLVEGSQKDWNYQFLEKHPTWPQIITQEDFCHFFNVHHNSTWRWKEQQEFWEKVGEYRGILTKGRVTDVMDAIYKGAIAGNPQSQRLFMEVAEKLPTRIALMNPDGSSIDFGKLSYNELLGILNGQVADQSGENRKGK